MKPSHSTAVPASPPAPVNPCVPSPCGPNSQCQPANSGHPTCSCLPNFIGGPPNCRPECVINSDCSRNLACINNKCRDPCPGSCGQNAQCQVISNTVSCSCLQGYIGNPFDQCNPEPSKFFWGCLWFDQFDELTKFFTLRRRRATVESLRTFTLWSECRM